MNQTLKLIILSITFAGLGWASTNAQTIQVEKTDSAHQEQLEEIRALGIKYLLENQDEDGAFSKQFGPGVTAIATTALIRSGMSVDSPEVQKAIEYLVTHVQDTGGIHAPNSIYRNYETCTSIMCFVEANKEGRYDDYITGAEKFIRSLQWATGLETGSEEEIDPDHPSYGGFGYGKHRRPDLNNTSYTLETLNKLGTSPDDEAIQRALVFVSRTQNLKSEHNNTKFADKIMDGGFYYTPAAGGGSQANSEEENQKIADGDGEVGLRSYGSMTYSALKSMIFAGVSKDDERVSAAINWIRHNYTLEENPGMSYSAPNGGQQGLFYYYHTFAKALDVLEIDTITDKDGVVHDWRVELVEKLADVQNADGSWTNENDRWLEADPNLVTGYILLALAHTDKE